MWTHPDSRGRGIAAASLVEGRVLFYSTSSDNLSSQAAAKRLGLRRLGRCGSLSGPSAGDECDFQGCRGLDGGLIAPQP